MSSSDGRIYIALGGNLDHPAWGSPRATLEAALAALGRRGVSVRRVSRWYHTAPVPVSDQPWYVNAVAEVETGLDADALLAVLHAVEAEFGRVRTVANAARLIDLLGDPARAAAMGERAHRLVGERFSLEHQASATLDVYRELLEHVG